MQAEKKVSIAVIRRLPRYYRYLYDLMKMDIHRISSKELSERMGLTASQIRQDLNCFGGFGQQGYGYNVQSLYEEIGRILGVDRRFKAIIIGAGNMGNALVNYKNFETRGYDIVAIFDVDPDKIGQEINGLVIKHSDGIEEYVKDHNVEIAILTVPNRKVSEYTQRMEALNIKGILNFSPQDLVLSSDTVVENIHLSDSLMVLGYRVRELDHKDQENIS